MIYPSGTGSRINRIFERLYSHFGPQHWWPADSSFEVIIGAILTQNTSWSNVEKAISAIKKAGCLNPRALFKCPHRKLARLIKSAGYYNLKAKRLRSFFEFFFGAYSADISRMGRRDLKTLRRQLLEVKGIGPETADSILLYALNKPVFVIDAYTKRMLCRHHILGKDASYEQAQDLFMRSLKNDRKLFNEYHALIVKMGKEYCRKRNPRCKECPIHGQ